MKDARSIWVKFLTMVMVFVLLGCAVTAFAEEGTNNSVDAISSGETIESNVGNEDEESEVQYEYIRISPFEKEETLYIRETIVNSADNEIELFYNAELEWPESEEEILARFLRIEGGNFEEKTLIANIIVARKFDPRYPDNLREILCQAYMFHLYTEMWNELAVPTEEDYAVAKTALDSPVSPLFTRYELIEFVEEVHPEGDCYFTEHFAFFN